MAAACVFVTLSICRWPGVQDGVLAARLQGFIPVILLVLGVVRPSLHYGFFAAHEQLFGLLLIPCALLLDSLVYAALATCRVRP